MNPALSQEFHLFCEQEKLQKHTTLDKNPYSVYGNLNDRYNYGDFVSLVHAGGRQHQQLDGCLALYVAGPFQILPNQEQATSS